MRMAICETCNGQYVRQHANRRYCSPRCRQQRPSERSRHARVGKTCVSCGAFRKGTNVGQGDRCRKCARRLVPCRRCGEPFWPWAGGKHARKLCGCRPQPKPKTKTAPSTRECAWCRSTFLALGYKRYCSIECRRRSHTSRHHLRRRGLRSGQENISLLEIYARDGGRCGLCHRRVRRDMRGPRRHWPTIDHIVPVARGGRHVKENVQLAHYGCNSGKRERACGSQLRLIA